MKNIITKSNFWVLVSVISVMAFFAIFINIASADCTLNQSEFIAARQAGKINSVISKVGNTEKVVITNSTGCTFPASLSAYKMFDKGQLSKQVLFSKTNTQNIGANTTLTVNIPSCKTQIDLWYGSAPTTLLDSNPYGNVTYNPHVWNYKYENSTMCDDTPPPPPVLTGSCSGTPSSVNIGGNVTWNSSASGGTGSYTYSWIGTDALSGNSSSVSKSYSSAGQKIGTITILSGSQSVTKSCAVTVNPPEIPTLNASCSASPSTVNIGDSVGFSASASGGTGAYSYSWSGTDGLSGNDSYISKVYSSAGIKVGLVTVTSGSQSVTRNCSAMVNTPPDNTLVGSCSVTPTSVNVGGYLNWSASASGGGGSYTYSWSGTDGLSGNSSSASKSYSAAGTKTGAVIITSGSQSITRTCSAVVNEINNDDLIISCSASQSSLDIDEDVTWHAYASGGNGSYDYDWDGTDNLSGSSRNLTWSYDDSGTKRATVTVTSDGHTASASCTTRVYEEDNDDLSVSCYANPSSAQVGSRVRWYVDVSGGDGDYDYDWNGTEGLNTSTKNPYMTYDYPGSKSATVTVTDGDGQEESDTCRVNVNSVLAFSQTYQAPLESAVYLSQVPYTGLAENSRLAFFIGMLALFSAWIAYIVISYKKEHGELSQ
jgi:hypothetical protein